MSRPNKSWKTKTGPWAVLICLSIVFLTFLAVEARADTVWTITELVFFTLLTCVVIWCHLRGWLGDPGYIPEGYLYDTTKM